jgi:uncharacterized protein
MFNMGIHENARGRVVAVCDSSLIGKILEEGDAVLDLKAHAAFYGKRAQKQEILEALKNFTSLNIVGSDSVALAIGAGIVEESEVLEIAGVPHAQVYKI